MWKTYNNDGLLINTNNGTFSSQDTVTHEYQIFLWQYFNILLSQKKLFYTQKTKVILGCISTNPSPIQLAVALTWHFSCISIGDFIFNGLHVKNLTSVIPLSATVLSNVENDLTETRWSTTVKHQLVCIHWKAASFKAFFTIFVLAVTWLSDLKI